MIKSVEKDFDNSKGEVNDVASGVFNTALGIGQVSGPLVGSLLTHQIGFRNTTDILSIYAISFGALYFIFGGGLAALIKVFYTSKGGLQEERLFPQTARSIEIEMNSSYNFKMPINDYFNRSLSDNSLSMIKHSWQQSYHTSRK